MSSREGPDCSLTMPFLSVVFPVSNLEGWNYIMSAICLNIIGQGEELNEGIDEAIMSKNFYC